MPVETLEDLFLVELKDVYDTEHRLLDALTELADQTSREEIASSFTEHKSETEQHIERLEQVFEAVGEDPEREECEGIEGMIEETEEFLQEKEPTEDITDRFVLGAAQKAERYEITAYQNMLQWAEEADMDQEVLDAIQQNLEEEQAALEELQTASEEFDYQAILA